ncbi:hypothetical protein GL4_2889 [Methyloceanibacter caenitepidi]|uniref:Uncharacterized protein n=1 Tax=Methyloceanibacter caenitepidi TaxID=1384459 RepID=A0A0A8K740_9HYPH|nr:hypothetical protein GL4_2889 [Methyloceanibacter caenitepidi]
MRHNDVDALALLMGHDPLCYRVSVRRALRPVVVHPFRVKRHPGIKFTGPDNAGLFRGYNRVVFTDLQRRLDVVPEALRRSKNEAASQPIN